MSHTTCSPARANAEIRSAGGHVTPASDGDGMTQLVVVGPLSRVLVVSSDNAWEPIRLWPDDGHPHSGPINGGRCLACALRSAAVRVGVPVDTLP